MEGCNDERTNLLSSTNDFKNTGGSNYNSFAQSDSSYSRNRPQPVNRRPFHYPVSDLGSVSQDSCDEIATYNRYRYYTKLTDPAVDTLNIPDHVVPLVFFHPLSFILRRVGKQNSFITIFAVWNTMMGTSLLSIPWTIEKAGFALAIVLMMLMSALCFYTAFRVLNMQSLIDTSTSTMEFSDICRHLMGKWAEWISVFFSAVILLGGAVVYWVFMSNFLYNTGVYIYESLESNHARLPPDITNSTTEVYCPMDSPVIPNNTGFDNTYGVSSESGSLFYKYWDLEKSVPLYIAVLLLPVVCLKSPTFFTKFNALGTLSVFYVIIFVIVKATKWGIHFESYNQEETDYVPLFKPSFPALTGVLSLAYFIHNCIISIMRNQRNPENNSRDLAVAFCLVTCTYLIVGVVFYISFPLAKYCIADNFLNNFRSSDLFSVITRVFLFFQMLTLFPLLLYLLRVQVMHFMFGNIYPSFRHIFVLNLFVVTACILFAVFYPRVGSIIRFQKNCNMRKMVLADFTSLGLLRIITLYRKFINLLGSLKITWLEKIHWGFCWIGLCICSSVLSIYESSEKQRPFNSKCYYYSFWYHGFGCGKFSNSVYSEILKEKLKNIPVI